MAMPQPNEHHHRLTALAGTWVGQEHMHPSPWVPEGSVADARIVNHRGAGGFVLAQDYEQRRDGEVVFSGHGVFWIDPSSGEVRLSWWDAMGMAPNEFRGRWDGDQLVLRTQSPMGHTRASWVLTAEGYAHTMEMSQDGEQWKVLMEGSYRREG
ncbi:MAG: DUF1579 family protein [Myxococcales bacterium]|nr:DUF1579 family protein [Myxococcales bacterium]